MNKNKKKPDASVRLQRMLCQLMWLGWVVGLPAVSACHPERPDGWTEETHGRDADPNYPMVFSQDQVKRFDVVIDPADWQAMLDDLTQIYGEFGSGDPTVEEVPPEIIEACADKSRGEECLVFLHGIESAGNCKMVWEDTLGCEPDSQDMDLLARLSEACNGLSEGSSCTAPIGFPVPGTCLQDETLLCIPNQLISACDGMSAGQDCPVPGPSGDEEPGVCSGTVATLFCAPERLGGRPGGELGLNKDRDPIWVPCTVRFEGRIWGRVGLRFKGNSSLWRTWQKGSPKLPFKFDLDEFEDRYPSIEDQRLYGFKRLAFANNARDSSYLHEKVAGDLFREFGVPSPRRAFVRIFFDLGSGPNYFGLYTMAEVPDRPMFLTQFGVADGNLYKPEGEPATWQAGLPIDEGSFPKKTNPEQSDWSDVQAAIAALHASRENPSSWRAGLERVFDADGFLRWLAANTLMEDWDTYGNLAHNYYLYGVPADSGRLHWIPWDHNESFSEYIGLRSPRPLDLSTVDDQWPLIRFLIDDPVYRDIYWAYIKEFSDDVFHPASIRRRLQSEHDLIAPYVSGPEGERTPPNSFDTSLEQLFDHVERRHAAVRQASGL